MKNKMVEDIIKSHHLMETGKTYSTEQLFGIIYESLSRYKCQIEFLPQSKNPIIQPDFSLLMGGEYNSDFDLRINFKLTGQVKNGTFKNISYQIRKTDDGRSIYFKVKNASLQGGRIVYSQKQKYISEINVFDQPDFVKRDYLDPHEI